MKNITMYSGPMCACCDAAKRLLNRNNLEYKVIDVSSGPEIRDEMIKKHMENVQFIKFFLMMNILAVIKNLEI